MLEKVNPNQNQTNDTSYLTELMYHQAQNNVEALEFEIRREKNEERLFRLLEMQSEAQKQAYNLSLQLS